ncbi:PRD domain-containing protein [Romboutsia weinsteinii]|uniref:PRD domain-containing protein n=1 Tax=Romboutsia weinsteinii TaxID=2020949 RepID=A0A371IZN9_9FIRM|nr:BglG family transcription antiterminator [Romboutsia weinsteinii]RDY25877.1 PRD domain-containing protein [Romboutsia weinsteinii]
MNTRALNIIKILLNSIEPVSSLVLSKEIGCSTKTIQSEIKDINKELKNGEIVSIRGVGYTLEGNVDDIDLQRDDLYDIDRAEYIIKKIIDLSSEDNDAVRLEDLADSMYVSVSTVKNDLREVKNILENYDLKISSKHKMGICILGSEEKIIKFILNYSNKHDNSLSISDFLSDNIKGKSFIIKKVILETLNLENIILTDSEFKNLVSYILVFLSRNNTEYNVFIKDYITEYKIKRENFINNINKEEIINSIKEFCTNLKMATSIDLSNDQIFEECLYNHIRNLHKRVELNLNQYAITANEIKIKYPFAFELAKIAKKTIEKNLNIEINDDEIANIAIHVGGALERASYNDDKRVYKTIIVCASGVGTSMLIKSKLEIIFREKLEIIKVIPSYLVDYINVMDVDFVISTVPVDIENKPVINISPMLSDKEIKIIEKYIETETIYVDLDIKSLFSKNLFLADIQANTKEEVIELMSNKLIEYGCIDSEVKKSYFARENIATTEIGNMVAIPHGASGKVFKNSIAIGILGKPIFWEISKVRLVIMLALDKDKILDYEELFSNIYKRVDSIAKVISICENKSFEKFTNLFR